MRLVNSVSLSILFEMHTEMMLLNKQGNCEKNELVMASVTVFNGLPALRYRDPGFLRSAYVVFSVEKQEREIYYVTSPTGVDLPEYHGDHFAASEFPSISYLYGVNGAQTIVDFVLNGTLPASAIDGYTPA